MLSALLPVMPPVELIILAMAAVVASYIIFGITGFGSALIAAPVLAQAMPVAEIVPLLSLVDCTAIVINGIKLGKKIDKGEMLRLVPLMVIGSLLGIYILLNMPQRPMMLILGVFVTGYAIYTMISPPLQKHFSRAWVIPFGTIGGVFSAMFGAGGFLYAIYLNRRLHDRDAMRGTLSAVLGLSNFTRFFVFAASGVYNDGHLPMLGVFLLPAMMVGLYIGHRLTAKLDRNQFSRVFCGVLILAGGALIVRTVAMSGQ